MKYCYTVIKRKFVKHIYCYRLYAAAGADCVCDTAGACMWLLYRLCVRRSWCRLCARQLVQTVYGSWCMMYAVAGTGCIRQLVQTVCGSWCILYAVAGADCVYDTAGADSTRQLVLSCSRKGSLSPFNISRICDT